MSGDDTRSGILTLLHASNYDRITGPIKSFVENPDSFYNKFANKNFISEIYHIELTAGEMKREIILQGSDLSRIHSVVYPEDYVFDTHDGFQIRIGDSIVSGFSFAILNAMFGNIHLPRYGKRKILIPRDFILFARVSLPYHEVAIEAKCNEDITLNYCNEYLESNLRRDLCERGEYPIFNQTHIQSTEVIGGSVAQTRLTIDGNTNGIFLKLRHLDDTEILRVKAYVNNTLFYSQPGECLETTQDETTYYIPFNSVPYNTIKFGDYCNTVPLHRIAEMEIVVECDRSGTMENPLQVDVMAVTTNIFRQMMGMGSSMFLYRSFCLANDTVSSPPPPPPMLSVLSPSSSQSTVFRLLSDEEDKYCCISLEDIATGEEYGQCSTCCKNIKYDMLRTCLERKSECPMCRSHWSIATLVKYVNAVGEENALNGASNNGSE